MSLRINALSAHVELWLSRPFHYGDADCCQFVGVVALAITGIDYRDRFPRYASQKEAEALLAAHGGMVGLITSVFGEPKAPLQAARGDVIVADFGDGLAAGVCVGAQICAPGPRGLLFRDLSIAVNAWTL